MEGKTAAGPLARGWRQPGQSGENRYCTLPGGNACGAASARFEPAGRRPPLWQGPDPPLPCALHITPLS